MSLWKQFLIAVVLVVVTGLAWAFYVPSAAPLRAWLGLSTAAAPSEGGGAGAGRGGFGGGGGGGGALVIGAEVTEGRANARVAAIGDARSVRSVAVTPLVPGRLVALEVESGAEVRTGEPVARLDSDVEAIVLERAKLAVADAEATVARIGQLAARGAATDVQEREARLALAQARLEERDAALTLERRTITAPIDGVVGLLPVEVGAQVTTSTEIMSIEDRSSLLVEFRVPERVVGALRVGTPVTATPLAQPGSRIEGEIAALDNRIDLDDRTLRVQASLPNADDRLRAGMAFSIEIRLPGDPYPQVPALAVQWGAEGAYVWVGREGRAARQPVRIVQRNAERVMVAADLATGERVVVEGVQRLSEGAELRFMGDPPPEDPAGGAALSRAERPESGG
jgi:RND family efflux transporter MFP subunit